MSAPSHAVPLPPARERAEERKVLAGTLVGTTIEWYDFFIFAQLTGTLLAPLFLTPMAEQNPGLAQILAFAMIGISFFVRPLGAIIAGHLGDRVGRKSMLVFTLVLMGAGTSLIGVLPTYASIGIWAPILLVFLRILQGFSAGGEWGGAALMAVEHAPPKKRGLFGAYPQIGVPVGMILATGLLYVLRVNMSQEAFQTWGWRLPFLLSIVLIFVGYLIRRSVDESPVFKEMVERKSQSSAPLKELFTFHWREVLYTCLIFIANNAAGYLLIAFFISYSTKTLGMPVSQVLLTTTLASFGWLIFTMFGGWLSDRIGRVKTFLIGYGIIFLWMIPLFMLIDSANIVLYGIGLFVLTIGLGLSYGPMSAMYAEMFPVSVRYSGISIGYALGAIFGGAFAAMIAQWLLISTGWSGSVGIYIMVLCVISSIGVILAKETLGNDLRVQQGPFERPGHTVKAARVADAHGGRGASVADPEPQPKFQ